MGQGAQAIGAMAFGTAMVPKVDEIVGPGGALSLRRRDRFLVQLEST